MLIRKIKGFVDVVQKKYKVPVGAWPSDPQLKEIGRYSLLYCDLGCEGWALWILSKILGVSPFSILRIVLSGCGYGIDFVLCC
jgi:hypothetical protein